MFARSTLTRGAIVAFASVASIGGAASVAVAQENQAVVVRGVPAGSKMMLVSYRDLNLNYNSHRSVLFGRVGSAVRDVCDFDTDFDKRADYRTCRTRAWNGARPQMYRAFALASQRAYYRR